MAAKPDLVIRNGHVIDGTGGEARHADIAIAGGRIVGVGQILETGTDEIDAAGATITPGFVDIHTHYDGHATWTQRLQPSSAHGVTTVVMGNCGVGFAPCRAQDHDGLIKLMEGVEDIPGVVLNEGLPWNWETFPDYLKVLEGRHYDMDIATQMPHAALRVYVMGERGMNREPASEADVQVMRRLAKEAVACGALGFSTSRSINHRSSEGNPIASFMAAESELVGIAGGLSEIGKGVVQIISDFDDEDMEFDLIEKITKTSGRPISFSMFQFSHAPDRWQRLLTRMHRANGDGASMRAQVIGRPVGILLGLDLSYNPFSFSPSYLEVAHLPLADRVVAMRDANRRARILAEFPARSTELIAPQLVKLDEMFVLGDPVDYEPSPDRSLGALARAHGVTPAAFTYDSMLENDGLAVLYVPAANFYQGSIGAALAMIKDKNTVLGLGDGGAHCGMVCDASFTTYMLSRWTRGNKGVHDGVFSLPEVVRMMTSDTAGAVGLLDRGMIAPGYRADLNLIDLDRLRLHVPAMVYDLPSGRGRLGQKAEGYLATIVGGEVTYRDAEPTGALPGRLVRGPQVAAA